MKVLVAYATRHGATAGIAERLAATLTENGIDATAQDVSDVSDPTRYDAFIIGSAAYMHHWLKPAKKFVRRNRAVLTERPVWFFSSGPIGTDLVDEKGNDIFDAMRPKEFAEFHEHIQPRDEKVFFGAYDPDAEPVGFAERFTRIVPAANEAIPAGDFRDWDDIDAWAKGIANQLQDT